MSQFVDPSVSRSKFEKEVLEFRKIETDMWRRGCWLASAEFPEVFLIFGTAKIKPASLLFAVSINFTNYDMWPASVRMVNPFTREPYTFEQLPTELRRLCPPGPNGNSAYQSLMQAWHPSHIPFLCIPGVREYHENPGHTGDSWLLYRNSPTGTLFFLVDQFLKYGVEPITGYRFGLNIAISGYSQTGMPE